MTSRNPARRRLPDRRGALALELEHAGHRYRAHIGCYPDNGDLAAKQNSSLDAFAADAAIAISLLLQHGATPPEIGHAMRRSQSGEPASLIGAVVDELAALAGQAS